MADFQTRGIDFDVLFKLVEGLGSLKDSDEKSLGAVRSLQAYLVGCGLTTTDLLRLLTTDHYEQRIKSLERQLTQKHADKATGEVSPVAPPQQNKLRCGKKPGQKQVAWQNYEIETAKKMKERGFTNTQIAIHLTEEFHRPFTESAIKGLFYKKLKKQGIA